ncbi:MAG: flagellar assembly protein A, partial [Campylobacterales bacterium]
YAPFGKEHLEKIRNVDYLLDPRLQLMQEYLIRFRPLAAQPFKFQMSINADKFHSGAEVILKPGSVIKNTPDIKQQLFLYFNKVKLKNGMFIYLLDDALRHSMNKLAELATGEPFKQEIRIPLAAWPQPVETIDDRIIWHYRQKGQGESEGDRVNYADRGFVKAVAAGELLVEYIQPKNGKPGRTFGGRFIEVSEPKVEHYPDFGVDEATVEVKSEEGVKRYFAKDEGYVKLEGNVLSIDKTVTVGDIRMKSTGNVRAGVDKEVKIQVEGKDPSEEVIGADMVVEAMEVNVNGSVASGAKIKAEKVLITGQTHQSSELFAKSIDVNVLRGLAKGDEVKVRSLEGGRVEAVDAVIEQAVGGEVNASHVTVANLRGKVRLNASKSITVKQVTKGENRLSIDPMANEVSAKAIRAAQAEVDGFKKEIEDAKKAMEKNQSYLKKNQESFKQIQQKILEDKKEGRPPSEAFMRMAREFLGTLKKQEALESLQGELEEKIEAKKIEIERFDKEVLEAVIVNESATWIGHNEIRYRLPVLGKEFLQVIGEGDRVVRIRLVENQEGEYELMLVHG